MPIFEYVCTDCQQKFETIVTGSTAVECPTCSGSKLEKQLSVFAAGINGRVLASRDLPAAPCGTCGDPRGPGACSMD
jgi:putative FmdB family regulatory protein